jgi:hypothetical protein
MAEISVTVEETGHAHLNLTGLPKVEIRHSVELSALERPSGPLTPRTRSTPRIPL